MCCKTAIELVSNCLSEKKRNKIEATHLFYERNEFAIFQTSLTLLVHSICCIIVVTN